MSLAPVPEVRDMVVAAKEFVAGEIHFSALVGPISLCQSWARVHNAHPAIQALANDWSELVGRTWNEWGLALDPLTVDELRRHLARDLGEL